MELRIHKLLLWLSEADIQKSSNLVFWAYRVHWGSPITRWAFNISLGLSEAQQSKQK